MSNKNSPLWAGRSYMILTIIATIFLAYLNYTNYINISWWWVTVPLWGSLVAAFAFLAFCYILVKYYGDNEK